MDPGGEGGAAVEAGKAAHHGDQGLLGRVLGVGPVAAELAAEPVDPVDLAAQQLFEGVAVPGLCGVDQRWDVPLGDAATLVGGGVDPSAQDETSTSLISTRNGGPSPRSVIHTRIDRPSAPRRSRVVVAPRMSAVEATGAPHPASWDGSPAAT